MTLSRYEAVNSHRNSNWAALQQFRNEIVNAFDRNTNQLSATTDYNLAPSSWTPAVDIKELENEFIISADIPGVNPKDIEIQLEDGVLSIKGERHTNSVDEKDAYKRVERSNGQFYRRFSLPESADAEKIKAKSNNGVLELTIPKTEKVKPRKITVDS